MAAIITSRKTDDLLGLVRINSSTSDGNNKTKAQKSPESQKEVKPKKKTRRSGRRKRKPKLAKNDSVSTLEKFSFTCQKSGEQPISTAKSKDKLLLQGLATKRRANSGDHLFRGCDSSSNTAAAISKSISKLDKLVLTRNEQEILKNMATERRKERSGSQNGDLVMYQHESALVTPRGENIGDVDVDKNGLDSSEGTVEVSCSTALTEEMFEERMNQLEQRMIVAVTSRLESMTEMVQEQMLDAVLKLSKSWQLQGELLAVRKDFGRKETDWEDQLAHIQEELETERKARTKLEAKLVRVVTVKEK